MSNTAKDMLNSASDTAQKLAHDANDTMHRVGHDVSAEARRLRDRLSEGTEGLSEAARERVVAARHRAVEARRQASSAVSNGRDSAGDLFDRQPLVIGALAFAVGAAVAALLPKTRTEDSYLGARRDALMDEAERVYHEERARAERAIAAARSELETAAQEAAGSAKAALKDAASQAEGKVRKTVDDVADKAAKAADK